MDEARQDHGIKWVEVARRADIAVATLLRYRKGEQRTPDVTRAIEKVFGWGRGHINAILSDEPLPEPEPEPQPEPDEDAELREIVRTLRQVVEDMQRLGERDKRDRSNRTKGA